MRLHPRRVPPTPRFQWPPKKTFAPPALAKGKRFSEYLVRHGVLSRGAVAGSLAADDGHPAWYGTLGVLLGFLDRPTVDRILRHKTRSGLGFQEIAIATGAISRAQSQVIVDLIEKCGVTLTEISTALAHMSPEDVGRYLLDYRSELDDSQ